MFWRSGLLLPHDRRAQRTQHRGVRAVGLDNMSLTFLSSPTPPGAGAGSPTRLGENMADCILDDAGPSSEPAITSRSWDRTWRTTSACAKRARRCRPCSPRAGAAWWTGRCDARAHAGVSALRPRRPRSHDHGHGTRRTDLLEPAGLRHGRQRRQDRPAAGAYRQDAWAPASDHAQRLERGTRSTWPVLQPCPLRRRFSGEITSNYSPSACGRTAGPG